MIGSRTSHISEAIFCFIVIIIYFHVSHFYFVSTYVSLGVTPFVALLLAFSRWIKFNSTDLLLLLFLVLFLNIAYIFKSDLRAFLANAAYFLLYIFIYSYVRRFGAERLLSYLLLGGFAVSLISVYIHLDPEFYSELILSLDVQEGFEADDESSIAKIYTTTIPFINPNTFGYMFLPLVFFSYFKYKSGSSGYYLIIMGVFLAIAVLTFSKGVSACILVGMLVLAVRGNLGLRETSLILVAVSIAISFGILYPLLVKIQSTLGITDVATGGSETRIDLLISSLNALDLSNILGTNDGSFRQREFEQFGVNEHNFFLSSVQWNGLLYTLTFLTLNGLVIFQSLNMSRLLRRNGRHFEKLFFDCLLAVLIAQFVSLNLGPPYAYHWIILGMASAACRYGMRGTATLARQNQNGSSAWASLS